VKFVPPPPVAPAMTFALKFSGVPALLVLLYRLVAFVVGLTPIRL
jgi:hypothetical protein